MKKYILSLVLVLSSLALFAQSLETTPVTVGDVFKIGALPSNSYTHIAFPKANFITKRGGIASYNNMANTRVEVSSINKNQDGTTTVKIKRSDGGRFFGSHNFVPVAFEKALETKELISE